jgi:uncharacterized lipoprotein YbaY
MIGYINESGCERPGLLAAPGCGLQRVHPRTEIGWHMLFGIGALSLSGVRRRAASALRTSAVRDVWSRPHLIDVLHLTGALVLAAGCGSGAGAPAAPTSQPAAVTGQVTYLQRVALPATAVVEVSLADVSRADAPAEVIASQRIETQGRQVPFAFTLSYDSSRIDSRFTYAVSARITDTGRLLFVSTRRYLVITRGNPQAGVEVVLDPV